MLGRYPILKKHRWLLPLCRIHRLFRAILFRRNVVKMISNELDNADMDEGKRILNFKQTIGL